MSQEIVRLDRQIDAVDSRPAADRLLGGDPRQRVWNHFSDSTGQFHVGAWSSTVGRWRVRYTENEFCHVTSGRMRITSASGVTQEFGAGQSFVVPAGFEGVWEVIEDATKLYAIFEKA
jgi:uncharacterized cupin superfamily protein